MAEINRDNFEERYPEIEENIRSSLVVAVDTEFSGLLSDQEFKPSLFDTGNERYNKLRCSVEQFVVLQIGITTFRHNEVEKKFDAHRYTFHVFPRSFGSLDSRFMCQSSSLEFLCQHGFDFNKFAYGGISYLNQQQEAYLRKELKEGTIFRNLERTISFDDEKAIQIICSRVAEWTASAVLGDILHLEDAIILQGEKRLAYIIHKELRQRFPNIWTFADKGRIRVEKISQMQRKEYEGDINRSLDKDFLDSLLGFSRIFKLLVELRKPIVGHNLLLDLIIMYKQFHKELPTHLDEFKKQILKLFPVIYDTKYLSYELNDVLKKEDTCPSNILCDLYHFFKDGRGRYIVLFSPIIELQEGPGEGSQVESQRPSEASENEEQSQDLKLKFHEAGWDSFCTGYCFIRMAHIFAHISLGSILEGKLLSSKELMLGVTAKKNCVNIIRGSLCHVCLDGPDPPSQRPRWLFVRTRKFHAIDISKVAELFARYGAVDVKPFNTRYRALVAVGNHGSAKDILRKFCKHKDFQVSFYNPVRHSLALQTFLWSTALVSGGITCFILYKHFNTAKLPNL